MASFNICVAPWGEAARPLAESLAAEGLPSDATMIYDGRRNKVVKLRREGRLLNVKAFRVPNIFNRIAYGWLRKSKARRSYEHAIRLRNLGFNTPEPLAYVEEPGVLFGRSYYVCQQLEGFGDMRHIETVDTDVQARLADDLGALMARLHDAGVWMKDFSQGNLLHRPVAKGHHEFFLIDINRMAFDVTDRRKLMLNFRTITDDGRFLRMLARAYARHAGLPVEPTLSEALAVRAHWLKKRKWKQLIKKLRGRK